MSLIKHVAVYVCILQVINRQLTGTLASNVSINQTITKLFGNNDTDITCSFIQNTNQQIVSVEIISKNITEDSYDTRPIAIFKPEQVAKLHSLAKYLTGRVTLTNITKMSVHASLTFHMLKRIDEKDYKCKYYYNDMDGATFAVESLATRILVKVPVSDVHINNQPYQKQYDRKTDNITLTCKANKGSEPTYKWFKENKNDTIISRTSLYVIDDIIRNNSGVYVCEAYNTINGIYYTQSTSVEIVIVDYLLLSPKSASANIYAVYAVCVVTSIIVIGFICRAAIKYRSNQSKEETNKESCCQNKVCCLMSCHCFTKKSDYTSVFGKSNNTAESEDANDGIQKNEINSENKEVDPVKTVDSMWINIPAASSNIYDEPKDTLPAGNVKYGGKYEDDGTSDQSAVYAEVIDQAQ